MNYGKTPAVTIFLLITFCSSLLSSRLYAQTWEGFENSKNKWAIADWKTRATAVAIVKERASEGKSSLKMSFKGVSHKDDAAFVCDSAKGDWSKHKTISFDIFSAASDKLELTIVFATGKKWQWFESKPIRIRKGWNKDLSVSMQTSDFKSEASEWKNMIKIRDLNDMQRLIFKIMATNLSVSGALYLDNISLK